MKLVEWYVTRYYQIMSTLLKLGLSGYDVKPRLLILVALDTYAKKMNPPTIVLVGGAR